MIKLSFSKPTYHVYNEGKVTRCTYHCKVINTEEKYPIAEFDATGEARCHANDVPNKNKGIMLADSRAKAMAYAKVRDAYSTCEICQMISKIKAYMGIVDFYNKMRYLKQQEDKHFNWLVHTEISESENNN